MKSDHARAKGVMARSGYGTGGMAESGVRKYARGGKTKGPSKVTVNVVVPHSGAPGAAPVPMPVPVHPPMAGPPAGLAAGAPPPMAPRPPMPPGGAPPGLKRGGVVKMDAGAGGAKGRLEKIKAYGKKG
jgi:hypothetical protein